MSSEQLFANGRIAVLSNKLLTADKYLRLAEANSVGEAFRLLSEFGYSASDATDCEEVLRKSFDEALAEIKELCTSQNVLRFLLCKYDYHNAKTLMKGKYSRQDFCYCCFGDATYPVEKMRDDFNNDDYAAYSKNMAEACDEIDSHYADGNRSAQLIDRILDKACFADIRRFSRLCTSKLPAKLAEAEIDVTNITLVLRLKKAGLEKSSLNEWFVEGGSISRGKLEALFDGEADLSDIPEKYRKAARDSDAEKTLSAVRAQLLADYADPMGFQPPLQYFYTKVAETELLRRIIADIKNGVDKDKIKEKINVNAR